MPTWKPLGSSNRIGVWICSWPYIAPVRVQISVSDHLMDFILDYRECFPEEKIYRRKLLGRKTLGGGMGTRANFVRISMLLRLYDGHWPASHPRDIHAARVSMQPSQKADGTVQSYASQKAAEPSLNNDSPSIKLKWFWPQEGPPAASRPPIVLGTYWIHGVILSSYINHVSWWIGIRFLVLKFSLRPRVLGRTTISRRLFLSGGSRIRTVVAGCDLHRHSEHKVATQTWPLTYGLLWVSFGILALDKASSMAVPTFSLTVLMKWFVTGAYYIPIRFYLT